MRIAILAAAMAVFAAPACAGQPYTAPAVQPAETLEPPAELRTQAIALLRAVQANDVEAVGRFMAPKVTVVSGTLDLSLPRHTEALGPWANGKAAVAALGQNTGGDWDLPPNADIGEFLADMELDFIEGALTDGQPWGTDPLLPGTICTYGYDVFDPAAVKRAAGQLGIDASDFVMVGDGAPVLDNPKGKQVGTLSAGKLYALDSDTDTTAEWAALHLPEGGVGFIAVGEDGLNKPYGDGICFAKTGGTWKVARQASTGL